MLSAHFQGTGLPHLLLGPRGGVGQPRKPQNGFTQDAPQPTQVVRAGSRLGFPRCGGTISVVTSRPPLLPKTLIYHLLWEPGQQGTRADITNQSQHFP